MVAAVKVGLLVLVVVAGGVLLALLAAAGRVLLVLLVAAGRVLLALLAAGRLFTGAKFLTMEGLLVALVGKELMVVEGAMEAAWARLD